MSNKMMATKIATPYAEAFFQVALDLYLKEGELSNIFYQLMFDIEDLSKVLAENKELQDFLKNPLNPSEAKKNILSKCFGRKFSPYTLNFLNLLIDKKRIDIVDEICQKFLEKAYDFVCVRFVEVYSPVELTSKQEEILTKKLTSMIGPIFTEPFAQPANIELSVKIDQKLLGGLIIKVGSKVIDLSLRGELQRIAKEMDIII